MSFSYIVEYKRELKPQEVVRGKVKKLAKTEHRKILCEDFHTTEVIYKDLYQRYQDTLIYIGFRQAKQSEIKELSYSWDIYC